MSIEEVYYFDGFTPESDQKHYQSDPPGNLAGALQFASDIFLKGDSPNWGSFREYMQFCFGRPFVNETDISEWIQSLNVPPISTDMERDGRSAALQEIYQAVFGEEPVITSK
jgi:hypothetical protein